MLTINGGCGDGRCLTRPFIIGALGRFLAPALRPLALYVEERQRLTRKLLACLGALFIALDERLYDVERIIGPEHHHWRVKEPAHAPAPRHSPTAPRAGKPARGSDTPQ